MDEIFQTIVDMIYAQKPNIEVEAKLNIERNIFSSDWNFKMIKMLIYQGKSCWSWLEW